MREREGRPVAAIQQKSFDAPDDVRQFPLGTVDLVHIGSVTMGRGILEPGFRWSTSLKPFQGTWIQIIRELHAHLHAFRIFARKEVVVKSHFSVLGMVS